MGVVSAFTLAHSLTLFLAASGHVAVPPAVVEPAIALTVAWVGAMAVAGRGASHGFGLAFAFGLVHGLGFAGALAETLGDGSGTTPLLPLLAFNLGIETCQLVLVALALGAVAAADRWAVPGWEWRVGFAQPLVQGRPDPKAEPERGGRALARRCATPLAPLHRLASLLVTGSGLAWFALRVAG